jgi:hypothetical protein
MQVRLKDVTDEMGLHCIIKRTYDSVRTDSSCGVLRASQSYDHVTVATDEDSKWHEILETQTRPSIGYLSS